MIKILLVGNWHQKNENFLINFISKNETLTRVNNIDNADIIISANIKYNAENYPNKKFIFGNHFSVFPNDIVRSINNINNNCIYIQPSQPSVNTWQKELNFNNMPMKAIPFGVDTETFTTSNNEKANIFLYYKNRDPNELTLLQKFLKDKNIHYRIFNYQQKYNENDYLNFLKTCKYGIWLGRHESQGFALEEALSCNIPLFVWNVKLRVQEWTHRNIYKNIKSEVSTIPYWDNRCGEFFYTESELEETFNKFISKIDTYKPREYILENVGMEACYKKWNDLLNNL